MAKVFNVNVDYIIGEGELAALDKDLLKRIEENNWSKLSTYFKYPAGIRKLIYTTNTIEGYHRQIRKVTKNKGVFTSSCLEMYSSGQQHAKIQALPELAPGKSRIPSFGKRRYNSSSAAPPAACNAAHPTRIIHLSDRSRKRIKVIC